MPNTPCLMHTDLLAVPILYLSRNNINSNQSNDCRWMQKIRKDEAWDEWLPYMLKDATQTAIDTLKWVNSFRSLIQTTTHQVRSKLPKIYSQDLHKKFFHHPRTRIE